MSRRNPFEFRFERPTAHKRHAAVTRSPSDPNPDVQQDDNYATARRAAAWRGPPIGVRGLLAAAAAGADLIGIGLLGGAVRHLSLQFWDGLDAVAFAGVTLTGLAATFRTRRDDDARYGGLHSVLRGLAALFVAGRMLTVYLNVFPSAVPQLGAWAVRAAVTGSDFDAWFGFFLKAPLEWLLVLVLACTWRRAEPPSSTPQAPPDIWHDRFTPPDRPEDLAGSHAGLALLGLLVPATAPAAFTRADIVMLSLFAAAANVLVAYALVCETTDYGKAALRDPDETYPWFHPMSWRRFQVFELLGRAAPRAALLALAGAAAALALGRHPLSGAAVLGAYWLTSALLAPSGTRGLYDRLMFIFLRYPGGGRPAPGRFEMSEPVRSPETRAALVFFGGLAAATAAYSLATLVPTWPAVQEYWIFLTDDPEMDYTAIAMTVAFQALATAELARCTFNAAYAQVLKDRFSEGGLP